MLENVPTLSLASQDQDAERFASDLGQSFEQFGFAIIADHGIESALIEKGWTQTKAFFALPEAEKRRWHDPALAGARGYTPFGTEIAKDAKLHDLKEFWHVGRDLPTGHRFRDHMADNVWPVDMPGFHDVFTALYAAFDQAGARILSGVALHLGLKRDWFVSAIADGNSVLRLLHYPPVEAGEEAIRAEAHGDINLITLLLGAQEAGLQLLTREGQWLDVAPPPGAMVVNVGDMLERLTNHRLPSTIHRVINPASARSHLPRYSMPFFLHPASDFLISTLPECVDPTHPDHYPEPITANAFLEQRLREIGLLKG